MARNHAHIPTQRRSIILPYTITCIVFLLVFTPAGSVSRELDQNRIQFGICRAGRYALFGPTNRVYLPATPH